MSPANKGKTYPPEPLTASECRALLRVAGRGPTGVRSRAIVAVLWRAGLRSAELVALRPKDIDLDGGTLRVLRGKGGKARTVALDPEALEFVRRWLQVRKLRVDPPRGSPLFCTFTGTPLTTAYLRRLLPALGRRARLEKRVHPHGLRHTFACELAAEGVSLRVIQAALGHRAAHTTSGYLTRVASPEVVKTLQARPRWEASPETGGLQGLLGLPETRSATSESPERDPGQRPQSPYGSVAAGRVLALAMLPKARARRTR